MDFGHRNFENGNTVYSDTFDLGLTPEESKSIRGMNSDMWLDLEEKFNSPQ